jgi:hypothetical protein
MHQALLFVAALARANELGQFDWSHLANITDSPLRNLGKDEN